MGIQMGLGSQKENLEKELGTMKKDFAVDTKSAAYLYVPLVGLQRKANKS